MTERPATDSLVFGLLDDGPTGDPPLAAKLRDFTLWWSRYDYRGPVLEARSVEALLDAAAAGGHRTCLIQSPGNLVRERWSPESRGNVGFLEALGRWVEGHEFLAAGRPSADDDAWFGLDRRCLVVDVERWRSLPEAARTAGVPPADASILPLDPDLLDRTIDLEPHDPARRRALARFLEDGGRAIERFDPREAGDLGDGQREFLEIVARQVAHARRGVFLWNIESYDDVESPPPSHEGPLHSLYSVAAGFKPYRILKTHGFDDRTRVVFFDYSAPALAVKRHTVEEWDGRDYPAFVRHLFEVFPSPETYYQLWGDCTPDELDWGEVEAVWARELERWGGADAFAEHWRACRALPHEFVRCDVLNDPWTLVQRVRTERRAAIWWSNAFFTMIGNWFHDAEERRAQFERFAERIAATCHSILLYGADSNNVSVNGLSAGEYWVRYRQGARSALIPTPLHRKDIRT